MASPSELNRPDEILGERLDHIRTYPESINQTKDYSLNYIGVSFHRQTKMYESYIYYQKETDSGSMGTKRSVGSYTLASDAALARDICSLELGISSPSNFPREADYNEARTRELEERGIEVVRIEVDTYLASNVQKVIATVAEDQELKEPTEDDSDEESEFSNNVIDVEQRYASSPLDITISISRTSLISLFISPVNLKIKITLLGISEYIVSNNQEYMYPKFITVSSTQLVMPWQLMLLLHVIGAYNNWVNRLNQILPVNWRMKKLGKKK